jgi:hypothetical protein
MGIKKNASEGERMYVNGYWRQGDALDYIIGQVEQ